MMPVAVAKIVRQTLAIRLSLTYTIQENQVLLVCGAIHGLQINLVHLIAEVLALAPAQYWLQLLEIGDDTSEGFVRLLPHRGKKNASIPGLHTGCLHRKESNQYFAKPRVEPSGPCRPSRPSYTSRLLV